MVLVYYIYLILLDTLPEGSGPFYQLNVSSVISECGDWFEKSRTLNQSQFQTKFLCAKDSNLLVC